MRYNISWTQLNTQANTSSFNGLILDGPEEDIVCFNNSKCHVVIERNMFAYTTGMYNIFVRIFNEELQLLSQPVDLDEPILLIVDAK